MERSVGIESVRSLLILFFVRRLFSFHSTPSLHLDFIFWRSAAGKVFAKNVDFVHRIADGVIKERRAKLVYQSYSLRLCEFLEYISVLIYSFIFFWSGSKV